jgi:flagellar protein FliS
MLKSSSKEHVMGAAVAYSAYRRSAVETLSPRDLLVRLFEGLERFIESAAQAIDTHHYEVASKNCRRVRDILFELQSTLNFKDGGEIARQLNELYDFMTREVIEASLMKESAKLRQLQRVVRPLKEGWQGTPDAHAHTTSLTGDQRSSIINMRG